MYEKPTNGAILSNEPTPHPNPIAREKSQNLPFRKTSRFPLSLLKEKNECDTSIYPTPSERLQSGRNWKVKSVFAENV